MQFLESKGEPGVTCTKVETVEELLQEADVSFQSPELFTAMQLPWLMIWSMLASAVLSVSRVGAAREARAWSMT